MYFAYCLFPHKETFFTNVFHVYYESECHFVRKLSEVNRMRRNCDKVAGV